MTFNITQPEEKLSEVHPLDAECVSGFIHFVWNENRLSEASRYLHQDYVDHSMPFQSFQNQKGLLMYLRQLGRKVRHRTEILGLTTIGELIICEIKIFVRSLSDKGNLNEEVMEGYRIFGMFENKIIAHWEVL